MPAFSALVVHPCAEIGINDDWSYIKTAQVLAQSGHIVYNGWATAMLGWQLYLGALFIKLFGFSFSAVRLSMLVVAMSTAFLLQRTLVRVGIREWNATLGTLALVLSPLFMPLAFSFMSDISGLFCIVLCLYSCLRALQASTLSSTIAWISFAALSNAIGGTARQIVWLGVLVMVPSSLWLLRKKPRVVLVGGACCLAGIGIIAGSMHWFNQQPYAIAVPLVGDGISFSSVQYFVHFAWRGGAKLLLLLVPVLLMFAWPPRKINRRIVVVFAAVGLCAVLLGLKLFHSRALDSFLLPHPGDYVSFAGLADVYGIMGERPFILHLGLGRLLTVAAAFGLIGLLTFFFGNVPRLPLLPNGHASISWHDLGVILTPFSVAYIALLAPLTSIGFFYDRYLLPLMMLSLLVLVRYYQERVRSNLPIVSAFLIGIFACFGAAATHDLFAMYRGAVAAIGEIRSSGVPATAIIGSWEYDAWTQIEKVGYFNDRRIRIPSGAYVSQPVRVFPKGCDGSFLDRTPVIKPIYSLSFDPGKCDGQSEFPPVVFHTWLAPHVTPIYVVKFPALSDR